LLLLAAPVWAQTITAPGLVRQPACTGGHTDRGTTDLGLAIITYSSVPNGAGNMSLILELGDFDYSHLREGSGDGGPTAFPINVQVNTGGAAVETIVVGTVTSTNTSLGRVSVSPFPVAAKTPYVAILYVNVPGRGVGNPLAVSCFMTGGTYTITNLSINNGSNGCFSISPRTQLDIRNCLCGRGATGSVTIDGSAVSWDYSSIRANWGCDGAG